MNWRLKSALGALAGALALIVTPSCALDQDAQAPGAAVSAQGGEEKGALLWAATWTLTWDTSRVDFERGGGWSVETDLGYQVHLRSGWFIDHSVSFGPCNPSSSSSSAQTSGSSALRWLGLGVREAKAHEDADPSAIEAMYAEDLARPTDAGPWPAAFAPNYYCRAHWLVGKATSKIDGAPDMASMLDGRSVRIAASWERDGVEHPFYVDTWWPQGHLEDLDDLLDPEALAAARADGGAWAARVTVKRDLGALFDGIDFESASKEQITGLIVENLGERAAIAAELFRPNT